MGIRLRLVDEWRKMHRWSSVWFASVAGSFASLQQAWPSIPDAWRMALPHWAPAALGWLAIMFSFGVIGARITTTRPPDPPSP